MRAAKSESMLASMLRFRVTLLMASAWMLTACEKAAPPEVPSTSAKRAPCDTDQSCNDDPAVSALWGRCVESVCQCQPGAELMPWGRCKPVH